VLKSQLDETLDKHRQEMAHQETTISDLKTKLEESAQPYKQSGEAESTIPTIERELKEKSEALEQSHRAEKSLIEESEELRERLQFLQGQLEEVSCVHLLLG
jgi:chromosome segregation ATPase